MTVRTHQVAVLLDTAAFASLKRLSAENKAPYATVISMALAAFENDLPASQGASRPLVIYQTMLNRQPVKDQVRHWRDAGGSFAAIGKRLFREMGICSADHLPLCASTIRGICAQ